MKKLIMQKYFSLIGKLAARKTHESLIIGITGSVGKTSTRQIIAQTLSQIGKKTIYSSPENFNGELGLPLSILGIEKHSPNIKGLFDTLGNAIVQSYFGTKKYDILVLEYGIDHIGEMDFMLKIAKPDISIVTIIDKVHGSQLGTPIDIANEKYKLSKNAKFLSFVCNDDNTKNIGIENSDPKKLVLYGKENNSKLDIKILDFEIFENENLPASRATLQIKDEKYFLTSNLISQAGILALGIGIYISIFLGQKFEDKNLNLNFSLLPGRENFLSGKNNILILDSTYNSSPASVKKMLDDFENISSSLYKERKKILLIGDMRELGDISIAEHENLALEILKTQPEKIFLVGNEIQATAQKLVQNGFDEKNIIIGNNSQEIGKKILDFAQKNDNKYILLAKGSQNTIFLEEGLKQILDESEHSKLVRQSQDWMTKKQTYFASL